MRLYIMFLKASFFGLPYKSDVGARRTFNLIHTGCGGGCIGGKGVGTEFERL